MAMYKVRFTVYKDPAGKTLKGPTALYFLGDVCSAIGLFGILGTILAAMEGWEPAALIRGVITAIAGFALCVVLHKQAKKSAELAILKSLGQEDKKAD